MIYNAANIDVYTCHSGENQKFKFEKVEEPKGTKTIEDGIYEISSKLDSNKVLDINNRKIADGSNVELYSKNGQNNQKFNISYLNNGYYTIEAIHSRKLLTVYNSGIYPGANVEQRENNNSDSQKWIIKEAEDGYYYIISKCNWLYLDVYGGTSYNGANIAVYTGNNTSGQKFKLTKTEESQNILEGKYKLGTALSSSIVLDVEGVSMSNGANVGLWSENEGANQSFKINYVGNGYYTIEAVHSGLLLTVKDSGTANCTNVEQKESDGTDSQKWSIEPMDGYYFIRSKCNGLYLDAEGGKAYNGTNICVYQWNGGNGQKFWLKEDILYGIDVSKYQGTINWKQVKSSNIDFAMLRVGIRGYETGKIVEDAKFKENITQATLNGIKCGVYFVTQATNYSEGVEEANSVLNFVKGYKIEYPIAIDVEWAGGYEGNNGRADYITVQERTQAIKGFCSTIKKAGYTPIIYANKEWLIEYIKMSELSSYDVWLAHYVKGAPNNKSDYAGDYQIWQYTSSGTIPGISGNVDINICYKKY